VRHFLRFRDFERAEFEHLFARTRVIKERFKNYVAYQPLVDRMLAMVFEKSSTRTRVSFEAGIHQLGGSSIVLNTGETQLGPRRADRGRGAGRLAHGRHRDDPHLRALDHRALRLAVARAGDQRAHQRAPSLPGARRHLHLPRAPRPIEGKTVAWIGDGNNMCNTWIEAAQLLDFDLRVATPKGYAPDPAFVTLGGSRVRLFTDPKEAARAANLVTTDVWTSMGFEKENAARQAAFAGFMVDPAMMACARPDALFMHCLPAHRGEEVAAEVVDGPQSVVWDEAENRLHVQKALMEYLLLGRSRPSLSRRCREVARRRLRR
jgi:ornithine carbamoyltransferase